MTAPAPRKAAPIPADVWVLARGEAEDFEQVARQFREYQGDLADDICNAIASAIMQDRADRASQEERIREDERESVIDLIASWPEIGGYTGDLRQSILSTVLDRDAAIIQAIRERGAS